MKSTSKIFIIYGTTGEYSDRKKWIVRAVSTEELAKEFIILLDAEFSKMWVNYRRKEWTIPKGWNKLDPRGSQPDYTGVRYYYRETEINDDLSAS